MDRRGFLKGLAAVVGGIALNEAVPLGRVWSFPKEIKVFSEFDLLNRRIDEWNRKPLLFYPHGFALVHPPLRLFEPAPEIAEAYKSGVLGRAEILCWPPEPLPSR